MVVVSATPLRRTLTLLGMALVVMSAGLLGYFFGIHQAELDRGLVGQLRERVATLEGEREEVGLQLADSKLAGEVHSQTLAIQHDEMVSLRETLRDLREEVGFYRRLMDSSSSHRPLEIADLEILRADEGGDSRFRLLLTRPTDLGDWVSGTLWLDVSGIGDGEGEGNGESSVLSLAEVSDLDVYPIEFKFRYFQRLSGALRLPEGFLPRSVSVRVAFDSGKFAEVDRSFPWPDAV